MNSPSRASVQSCWNLTSLSPPTAAWEQAWAMPPPITVTAAWVEPAQRASARAPAIDTVLIMPGLHLTWSRSLAPKALKGT